MTDKRWFHGGAPGLSVILPPDKTGAPSTAEFGARGVCKTDKVYLTSSFLEATFFAAMYPLARGMVYEVMPLGEITQDPDYHGPNQCIEADSAKVLRKYKFKWKDVLKIRKEALQ